MVNELLPKKIVLKMSTKSLAQIQKVYAHFFSLGFKFSFYLGRHSSLDNQVKMSKYI